MSEGDVVSPTIPANLGPLAERGLCWSAWVAGVLLVLFVVADFAVSPLYYFFAQDDPQGFTDVWVGALDGLGWVFTLASCVAAIALVVCWLTGRRELRSSLVLIGVGLGLVWLLRVSRSWLGGLLFGRFTAEDAANPEFVQLSTGVSVAQISAQLILAAVIIVGAVRLRGRTGQSALAPQR